jgi:hypothetical protein
VTAGHPTAPVHAFYAARVGEFMEQRPEDVVGALTTRAALEFRGNQPEQARAWQEQVLLLQRALADVSGAQDWGLVLEYPLRRLGRRPDAVMLAPGVIIVVEFKMGADVHGEHYVEQVQDYALCIRDFHRAARGYVIAPIVCAEHASHRISRVPAITDFVADVILTNGSDLHEALRVAASTSVDGVSQLLWREFDVGGYSPTPTIVEAARAVYAGHSVAEIGRTDAEGEALQLTAERLQYWAIEARERKQHVVCLVSGTPGAGKSLLGLNLVLTSGAGRIAGEPAVMLTGNRPLVQVLRGALTADARSRTDDGSARRAVQGALQTLLGYLKEYAAEDASLPPEHVVVFDEAQRAWDEETGQKLLQRRRSEPELFLEILRRLPWACLVCLVGPGQEINRGEGGMALWGVALKREACAGRAWRVIIPSSSAVEWGFPTEMDPALHLAGGLRAFRNARFGEWVDALLSGDVDGARALAVAMTNAPAVITRDLRAMKHWLSARRRGGRRPGLVVSSAATRLVADGLPPAPMSNELHAIENWFLRSWPDFRGSDSLEVPLSEFGCQGLELDYVGLTWGGDLVWSRNPPSWIPRRMRAPNWQVIRRSDAARYRVNSYRVLLTRAREGLCIYVPKGSAADPTRNPQELDAIADTLVAAGCSMMNMPPDVAGP